MISKLDSTFQENVKRTKIGPNYKVCLITGEYPPEIGGVSGYTYNLAQSLSQNGLDVTVITRKLALTSQSSNPENELDKVKVLRILPQGAFGFRSIWRLLNHLKQNPYDAAIFQYVPHMYGRAGIAPLSATVPLLLRLNGVTNVCTMFHEAWVGLHNGTNPIKIRIQMWFQVVQAFLIVLFSRTTVTSNPDFARRIDKLNYLVGHKSCRIVPVGSNIPFTETSEEELALLRSSLDLKVEGPLLVVFSPFTIGKDLEVCLYALQQISSATLLCLGGTNEKTKFLALQQRAVSLNVADRLKIKPGPLSPQEISGWLQVADIYLHTTDVGASGRSTALAAALQHGLPTVSYTGVETSTFFVNSENIILVHPGDKVQFASALRLLWHDQVKRDELGLKSRQLYERKFDFSTNCIQVLTFQKRK